jgi:hypothetical protein
MTRTLEEINSTLDRQAWERKRQARIARQASAHRRRMRERHQAVANGYANSMHAKLDRELDDRVARDRS